MRSAYKIRTIPDPGRLPDLATVKILEAMKEAIEVMLGRRGADNLDRVVTYRDLVSLGMISESQIPNK